MKKLFFSLLLSVPFALLAQGKVDVQTLALIRHEGYYNSKVMDTASMLSDRFGGRLTGSPEIRQASDWAVETLKSYGLPDAHLEPWKPYGRGWSWDSAMLRMTSPANAQFYAIPKAWSPGTNGAVKAQAIVAKMTSKDDLEKYRGKLAGRIVLNGEIKEVKPPEKVAMTRYDEAGLEKVVEFGAPRPWGPSPEERVKQRAFKKALNEFLASEGALGVVESGEEGDGGTFNVVGESSQKLEDPIGVPAVVIPVEQFNRMLRLIDHKMDVSLELDVKAAIDPNQDTAWNVVADMPGTDKKNEVVIIGAHIDSWHGGTGATDNSAGVAVMMEAMRILKTLDLKPRRTIRIALWSGEEQGLLGSAGYVAEHYAKRTESKDPADKDLPLSMRKDKGVLELKPDHARVSAYFNLDNGTGKIRGVYAQENALAVPLFEQWIAPLRDLGVSVVTMRNTSSTDHISFDNAGIPGFQFVQDWVEYSRTHHSNSDVYERLQKEDLMQAAVVVASFAWNAANREQMMPRKTLPK
jgi:Predicted aminopeptidases